jgi:hypothetical protein
VPGHANLLGIGEDVVTPRKVQCRYRAEDGFVMALAASRSDVASRQDRGACKPSCAVGCLQSRVGADARELCVARLRDGLLPIADDLGAAEARLFDPLLEPAQAVGERVGPARDRRLVARCGTARRRCRTGRARGVSMSFLSRDHDVRGAQALSGAGMGMAAAIARGRRAASSPATHVLGPANTSRRNRRLGEAGRPRRSASFIRV